MAPDAPRLIQLIRRHWGIENNPYSVLDVAFAKHKTCKRTGNAAQDFSLLYRIAPHSVETEALPSGSKGKHLEAVWDPAYLLKLLGV